MISISDIACLTMYVSSATVCISSMKPYFNIIFSKTVVSTYFVLLENMCSNDCYIFTTFSSITNHFMSLYKHEKIF